jgi:hypothetical protein
MVLAVADAALGASLGASLGGGGPAVLARCLYEELMFSIAGSVAEEKIAGYRVNYVEVDVAGRTPVVWDAVRVARLEAGLPICGHKDCEIPFDVERIAEVLQRAEEEVFALLQANWPIVERVANALCKRDRLTTAELDALITGSDRAGPGEAQNGAQFCAPRHEPVVGSDEALDCP